MAKKAVFLDRDGVINELVLNPATKNYEAPHKLSDLNLIKASFSNLAKLQRLGFELFIVSNQPDYALQKASLEDIKSIAAHVKSELKNHDVMIRKEYYCYHHPKGVISELAIECTCRKPQIGSLTSAAQEFDIDLSKSWMIGDQGSDVECGTNAGCLTALVINPHSAAKRGNSKPTIVAESLNEVLDEILERGQI